MLDLGSSANVACGGGRRGRILCLPGSVLLACGGGGRPA